jgi:hypothetical protein
MYYPLGHFETQTLALKPLPVEHEIQSEEVAPVHDAHNGLQATHVFVPSVETYGKKPTSQPSIQTLDTWLANIVLGHAITHELWYKNLP